MGQLSDRTEIVHSGPAGSGRDVGVTKEHRLSLPRLPPSKLASASELIEACQWRDSVLTDVFP